MAVAVAREVAGLRNFDIAAMTDEEYANTDASIFIYANYRRYLPLITEKTGQLSALEVDDLGGLFWELGHGQIKKVHRENLESTGERRKQAILGTLKAIAKTRVVVAIHERRVDVHFDNAHSPDGDAVFLRTRHAEDGSSKWQCFDAFYPDVVEQPAVFFAADSALMEDEEDVAIRKLIEQLETVRHKLSKQQYLALNALFRGRGSRINDIAERAGFDERRFYDWLLRARQRLFEILPPEMQEELRHCLKRKDTR